MGHLAQSIEPVIRSWAGWWQGVMLNDAKIPFLKIVQYTKPFLVARSFAGAFMATGHLVFAFLAYRILRGGGPRTAGPTLFYEPVASEVTHE